MPDFPVLPGLGSDTYPTVYQPLLKLLSFCKLKMYLEKKKKKSISSVSPDIFSTNEVVAQDCSPHYKTFNF